MKQAKQKLISKTRKYLPQLLCLAVLVVVLVGISGHVVFAEGAIDSVKRSVFEALFAYIGEAILYIASFFLTAAGTLLNVSINITLQIKQFIANIPAVYTVWRSIRDISGMFIIFALLVMAFQIILDLKRASFGEIMKNIVMAGILINFSFFIVAVLIDVSNVVSMQLFRQMTPTVITLNDKSTLNSITQDSIRQGSIADIFMSSLNITQIYQNKKSLGSESTDSTDSTPAWLRILVVSFAGAVMMITTGLSFIFASLAFIIRLVILVFLLGFSPIWFAAYVIPELKEYAKKGWDLLYGQLVFMPVYLLLMYLALSVVNSTGFRGINLPINSSGNFWYSFLGLIVNCIFVIIMLNIPLVAALKIGTAGNGVLKKLGDNVTGKIGAGAVWNRIGNWSKRGGASAWTNTGGRAASAISRSEGLKSFASKWKVGEYAYKGIKTTAGGYDQKLGKQVQARTEFGENLGINQGAVNTQQDLIRQARADLAAGIISPATANNIIGVAKSEITRIKNERKFVYANRIKTRGIETLYMKGRKNKVAAAKIHIDVWEAQLKDAKDDLRETKNDIKQASAAGLGTPLALTLPTLQAKEITQQDKVDQLEKEIGAAKLIR